MNKAKLVIGLMVAIALIIAGMAVYVFTNFNNLSLVSGLILAAIGIILLFLVMVVVYLSLRSSSKK